MNISSKLLRLTVLAVVIAVAVGISASSAAAASPVKSIQTVLSGSPPASPPYFGTAAGSYKAFSSNGDKVDAGSVVAELVLPAQPPKSTQIETFRTITSENGTLKLHCSEISRPGMQFEANATAGSCAVLSASGVFGGLTGQGTLAGSIGPNALTDTITF